MRIWNLGFHGEWKESGDSFDEGINIACDSSEKAVEIARKYFEDYRLEEEDGETDRVVDLKLVELCGKGSFDLFVHPETGDVIGDPE
jgi:hypothetical protein